METSSVCSSLLSGHILLVIVIFFRSSLSIVASFFDYIIWIIDNSGTDTSPTVKYNAYTLVHGGQWNIYMKCSRVTLKCKSCVLCGVRHMRTSSF
jgi:hypothetical protein